MSTRIARELTYINMRDQLIKLSMHLHNLSAYTAEEKRCNEKLGEHICEARQWLEFAMTSTR